MNSNYTENNLQLTQWWLEEWNNGNRIRASIIKRVQERIKIRRDKALDDELRKRESWGSLFY